jgi:putative phosphoesterase
VSYRKTVRLALISDLHGNELALEAVISDARRTGVEQFLCLGDVATLGPRPSAVLGRLMDLGCACILGNHDEFMLDAPLVRTYSEYPTIVASVDATREALSAKELAFIQGFSRTLKLEDVFAYHGTPRSNMENLLATTPAQEVDTMLGSARARVYVGGHTHLQLVRQHHGTFIVNPGSLGMPFRDVISNGPPVILPHAEYAVIDVEPRRIGVELRRVELERSALAAQIDGWDNPLAASLAAVYA